MKRISVIIILLALSGSVLFADGLSYGFNGELAMPMGDFGDVAKTGFGVTGNVEYGITDKVTITGSVGYLMFGEELEGFKYTCTPIKAGAKYAYSPIYGIFELGIYQFALDIDDWGSDSESKIGIAPGIGYEMKLNEKMKLDLSIQYEIAGDYDLLGIDIGIRF